MNSKVNLKKLVIPTLFLLFFTYGYSQNTPYIKHLDEETLDEVKIDYDKDGDLDIIIAGVFIKKNQGRVYAVRNNGSNYAKPEYLFSFPSIGRKQVINVIQNGDLTKITVIGTSPNGNRDTFIATLINGEFEGLTIPAISPIAQQ